MDNTLVVLLLISFTGLMSISNAVQMKKCRDFAAFSDVQVSGCEDPSLKRCPFVRGSNVSLSATFKSGIETNNVTLNVWGRLRVLRIKSPFPITPSSACSWGVKCPLPVNTTTTLKVVMPIRSIYPNVDVDVGVELWGDGDSRIVCVEFPATIVSK